MSLTLYHHPLSSFCQKVLVALYENATAFTPRLVDLGDPDDRAALAALWPPCRFPVLRDEARGLTIPESSVIIEHLDTVAPGPTRFVPQDVDGAREVRLKDRFFDLDVAVPMQKIVTDRLRPAGRSDAMGVERARGQLETALGVADATMADRT